MVAESRAPSQAKLCALTLSHLLPFGRCSTMRTLCVSLANGRNERLCTSSWSIALEENCSTESVSDFIKCCRYYVNIYTCTVNRGTLIIINSSLTFILEPDVGMAEKDAHRFFKQLMAAVVSKARLC